MTKFREEGMSKADWLKARPLVTYSQIVMQKKSS